MNLIILIIIILKSFLLINSSVIFQGFPPDYQNKKTPTQ